MSNKLLLFDIDETLINTGQGLSQSPWHQGGRQNQIVRECMRVHGIPDSIGEIDKVLQSSK
ncbi:MAG: hypothetical protein IEMM0007_1462 [bacterium]|nr:MAG: hypothetical protein IEMM0007_1462 [bacterium]